MILMFRLLQEVKDVNSFIEVDRLKLVKGNPTSLYFRLVQDKDAAQTEKLRYIPQSGSAVTVKFNNIDSNKVITRVATQPYASDDRSIWKVDVLATDQIAFDSMSATLTEGGSTYSLVAASDISAVDTGDGRFFC